MHLDFLDQILDHNHLHEALWLMHKTGMENRSDQNLNHVWLLGEGKVNKYDIPVCQMEIRKNEVLERPNMCYIFEKLVTHSPGPH